MRNARVCVDSKPPNKWDEERWIRHKGWLSTRATPKRLFEDEIDVLYP